MDWLPPIHIYGPGNHTSELQPKFCALMRIELQPFSYGMMLQATEPHLPRLMIAIRLGVKCYLIMVFICISLLTNDVEYLFPVFVGYLYVFFGKYEVCPDSIQPCSMKNRHIH